MYCKKIWAVYFSPVCHTREAVVRIAERMAEELRAPVERIDFTLPDMHDKDFSFGKDDLVVFGIPTYAGRIPNKILPVVQRAFHGEGTPAVPVVTFGNRSCDDSLSELRNELTEHGFLPFAAAALAVQHVMSDKIGSGRPDAADREEADIFAAKAAERFRKLEKIEGKLAVAGRDPVGPYYTPLGMDGQPAKFLKAVPKTDAERCDRCGVCVSCCPMGSVKMEELPVTAGICIKCQACVRRCPRQARFFDDPALLSHIAMLETNYARRAANLFFPGED